MSVPSAIYCLTEVCPEPPISYHRLAALACLGEFHAVVSLVEKGADVNCVSKYFGTPLPSAVRRGNARLVRYLLDRGAKASIPDVSHSPHWWWPGLDPTGDAWEAAGMSCNEEIISILLDPAYGIPPSGSTYTRAILRSVQAGSLPSFRLLKESAECLPTGMENYILLVAVKNGTHDFVRMALENGANVNVNDGVNNVLQTAISRLDHESIRMLLAHGADPDIGKILSPICMAIDKGDLDIVRTLLDHGASPDPCIYLARPSTPHPVRCHGDFCGILRQGIPIHSASQAGNAEIMDMLLERGADTSIPYFRFAKARATLFGDKGMIDVLKRHGYLGNCTFIGESS